LKVNMHKSSLYGLGVHSLGVQSLWLSVIKAIHGSNGSLHQPPTTCTGCYIWITIHKATASLKSKGVYLFGVLLFNLDLQKDAAQKFQNLDFAVSFRRRPRGGIEVSQFQKLSLAFFVCSILFR
ncbi:hypothetical protein Tco_1060275, partial [Tanacetum coccineum]